MGKTHFTVALVIGALASVAVADHHKKGPAITASLQDFEELRDRLEGRWIADLEVQTPWPKIGYKKGEIVTAYADFDSDLDGMVFVASRTIGNIKWRQTYHYDAVNSSIISNDVGSNGFWAQNHFWKISPDVFGFKFHGGQRDGRTFSGSGTLTFSKDGKKFTTAEDDVQLGDDDPNKDHSVFKKISE